MKKKITIYALALIGVLSLSGCAEDFLDQSNTHQLNQGTFFSSDESVTSATAPLYNYVWYTFNDKFSYAMGDGRSNNITAQYSGYIKPYTNFTDDSNSEGLTNAWNSLYTVVAQSNNTISNISNFCSSNVSETAKIQGIAEARFMRGLAYWYIGSLWGCGIIYTNTADLVDNYVVPAQPRTDVIEFAIRDLEYAAKYLPEKQGDAGRVTKYSAFAALSRVYLSMAGLTTSGQYDGANAQTNFNSGSRNTYYLDLAKKAAEKVINESGTELVENYGDLFYPDLAKFNNNKECLFQLQFMAGSSVSGGAAQSMTRFFGWSTMVDDTNNWGGSTCCSWDLWEEFTEYTDPQLGETIYDAIRRHHCVASYGEEYPELGVDGDTYIYGITEKIPNGGDGANIKKYVVGTNKANKFSAKNNSGVNTYMIRLAEVYLNYCDAVLGNSESTTDATALSLFNKLRTRAGVPTKSRINYEDLRHEYRLELAFESQYWYFLIRRGYYHQQEVVDYLNNQYRNARYDYNTTSQKYEISKNYDPSNPPQVSKATASKLILPMSATDQAKNPYLKPDTSGNISTEAYTFGDREVDESTLFD